MLNPMIVMIVNTAVAWNILISFIVDCLVAPAVVKMSPFSLAPFFPNLLSHILSPPFSSSSFAISSFAAQPQPSLALQSKQRMSVILATAGHDDKIRFWEAPSGICSRVLRFADSQVNCLEITPDKQYLAAGGNPHIRLFEINNSSNQNPILTLEGHTGNVASLGFQRNGRYLYSGSEDGTVKLWDLRSPSYSRSFDSKGAVNSVSLHPNQAEIISGEKNHIFYSSVVILQSLDIFQYDFVCVTRLVIVTLTSRG